MKFSHGDPVWVRFYGRHPGGYPTPGEYPGVVHGHADLASVESGIDQFFVEMPFANPNQTQMTNLWRCATRDMRPRRDDYQQHEPRTTWEDVKQSLRDNLPLRETVDES